MHSTPHQMPFKHLKNVAHSTLVNNCVWLLPPPSVFPKRLCGMSQALHCQTIWFSCGANDTTLFVRGDE